MPLLRHRIGADGRLMACCGGFGGRFALRNPVQAEKVRIKFSQAVISAMVRKRPLLVGGALFTAILTAMVLVIVGLVAAYAMNTGRVDSPPTTTTASTTSSTSTTSTTSPASTTSTTLPYLTSTSSSSTTLQCQPPQSTTSTTYVSRLPDYTKYASVSKFDPGIIPDSCLHPKIS